MFKLLRDIGSSLTSGESTTKHNNPTESDQGATMGKNKTFGFKSFKLKKKDVVEELSNLLTKYPYSRPVFLGLRTHTELHAILNHADRMITLPKRSALPRSAGYAE